MPKLYEITIPGLSVRRELPAVRRHLLAGFPQMVDVLATLAPGTIHIVYRGDDEVDGWLAALTEAVARQRAAPGSARIQLAHVL
ncbi:MAG TPA: hypothetical protein VG371_02440 [Solirubrobacteraceae bacterium]|jgi:hypothetical protein|nr:hypothetical protein [Solirubrobacteraceae bacterium]